MDEDRELEQLRARVAHLESLVERLTNAKGELRRERVDRSTEGVDRRRMLRNGLGLGAAAVAGVGMLDAVGSPAAASDGDAVTVSGTVSPTAADSDPTRITNPSTTAHAPVLFEVDNQTDRTTSAPAGYASAILGTYSGTDAGSDGPPFGSGVLGVSDSGSGVIGWSDDGDGVSGTSLFGNGLKGVSQEGTGLLAESDHGTALEANATSGTGVLVTADGGYAVKATSYWDDASIFGIAPQGIGVLGTSDTGWGMAAQGKTGLKADGTDSGVDATCSAGTALKATSTSGTGLKATSSSGIGVDATSASTAGVKGQSTSAAGVHAISGSGAGLLAESDSGTAVDASSTTGIAISGSGTIGIVATGTEVGVRATTDSGVGVAATSEQGIGGTFQGAAAAIRLIPTATIGHPTSGQHQRGEIVLDHRGKLWVCTKVGTPGTWKQLAFV